MITLALDTSTTTLHIALESDTSYEECTLIGIMKHSDRLLSVIQTLLSHIGKELKDIDTLICTRGPGSFTSLRIGMSTLKGIALASGAPIVSVSTLAAIADTTAIAQLPELVVIDAKKNRYYLGLYENGSVVGNEIDGNAEDIIALVNQRKKVLLCGPDAAAFALKLSALHPTAELVIDNEPIRALGRALISLGKKQLATAGPDDIGQGPAYIRKSDAEEALEAKQKENQK